jgi:hypothetical protein
MVVKISGPIRNDVEITDDGPHLAKVDWKYDPGLRKLYFWAFIICIASATTGYDAYAHRSSQCYYS